LIVEQQIENKHERNNKTTTTTEKLVVSLCCCSAGDVQQRPPTPSSIKQVTSSLLNCSTCGAATASASVITFAITQPPSNQFSYSYQNGKEKKKKLSKNGKEIN
jgi:hypothetical protein